MTAKKDGVPTTFKVESQAGSTVLLVNGDGNTIVVPQEVYKLATDTAVIDKVKTVVRPLTNPGYESLAFFEGDRAVDTIRSDEAKRIVAAASTLVAATNESVSLIKGPVRIKSPQYEGGAKWTVLWGGKAIDVTMPADWVRKFQTNEIQAPPGTTLFVEMEQRAPLDEKGNAVGAATYTVTKILEVIPPPQQADLLDPRSRV
jgi:hypothetical protein